MLIFLTFRYTKAFIEWRGKRLADISKETKRVKAESERRDQYQSLNQQQLNKK